MRVWLMSSTTLLMSCPTSRPSPGTSRTKRNIASVPGRQRLGSSASSLERTCGLLRFYGISSSRVITSPTTDAPSISCGVYMVYPKQGPGCATVGGSKRGAVDPRTHRKWVWKFSEAVAELVDIVARIFVFFHTVSPSSSWRCTSSSMATFIIVVLVAVDLF